MANTIVVGYDGSSTAKAALVQAIDLAKDMPDAEIMITCGHDRTPGWLGYEPMWKAAMEMEKLWDEMETKIAADLEEAAGGCAPPSLKAATACSRGKPAAIVVSVAATSARADIVLAPSRRGWSRNDL